MNPMAQTPTEASITLETENENKNLRLGRQVAAQLQKQGISEGDVVRIDSDSGRVQNLGKCQEDWNDSADISVGDVVPKPQGPVQQEREFTHTLTLHHIDKANASRGRGGLMSIFGMGGQGINEDI